MLASLDALHPDVVFLDVQMPGIDGFDVIRQRTPERMPAVVFLTAYDEFAIDAFEAQALDYLVKPVTEARFAKTMKRLDRQLRSGAPTSPNPRLVIPTSRGATVLPVREIDLIEAADNYVRVWTGGRSQLLRESMKEIEDRVRDHGFVRVHRRALVPLSGVRELTWMNNGEMLVVLESGARIEVSRRRRAAVVAAVRSQR